MACPNCKDPILNNTGSIIGNSKCNPVCPESIGCPDIISSGCVEYTGADVIIPSIPAGTNLNTVIQILAATSSNSCCGPLVWQDITLNEGYISAAITGGQAPQYAVDTNGKIWLRGTITGNGQGQSNAIAAVFPEVPLYARFFMNVRLGYTSGDIFPALSGLGDDGTFQVLYPNSTHPLEVTICLDGLSYETN